ncbi:uncharacterized protein RHO17_006618 [Thomomys bottae]
MKLQDLIKERRLLGKQKLNSAAILHVKSQEKLLLKKTQKERKSKIQDRQKVRRVKVQGSDKEIITIITVVVIIIIIIITNRMNNGNGNIGNGACLYFPANRNHEDAFNSVVSLAKLPCSFTLD